MAENTHKKVTNLIVVTEQLEQIDIIEKALKTTLTINTYTSNDITELKRILSKEDIDVVLIDDAETTIGAGSIRSIINECKLTTPILQLAHQDTGKADADFIKNGASIVCPYNDALAILHNTELLIAYSYGQKILQQGASMADEYRGKFNDLYQGLADPICYVLDGVFLDCNSAFLHAFELTDKEELEELTLLNFIERKHQGDLRSHLRKSARRDLSANPVLFNLQTKLGKPVEFNIMSKPSRFENEDAVQVYMRSTSEGGGATSGLFDENTGLSNRDQMDSFVLQKMQQFEQNDEKAYLAYLMIKNYRDVWGSDGFGEAEKFIKAIAGHVRKVLPAHTEASRYTDDGLLVFIPGEEPKAIGTMLIELIRDLDKLTPEGMERMVEPSCYAAYDVLSKDSDYLKLMSDLFRSSRNAALTEGVRVSQPTANEVAQKDTQRIEILQSVLKDETLQMRFQPIASFKPDNIERYRERLHLFHIVEEEEHELELDIMVSAAERYQLMHRIDKWKMNQLFNRLLGMDITSRSHLLFFINLSTDALKNAGFANWLVEQMEHTGLGGKHFVFEMMVDSVIHAYTGALNLSKAVRDSGARVAVSKIGSLSIDNERVISDIQPDIIKLDLREIDTLDENEEAEVMGELCDKADAIGATLIAEYLESPAQLSRIWPYGIKLIQGDSMTPILDDLGFNFDEFAI